MTGYPLEELVGRDIQVLLPPRERTTHFITRSELGDDSSGTQVVRDRDLTIRRRDGSELPAGCAFSRLTIDDNSWIIVEIRDKTAQRAAENAHIMTEGHAIDSESSIAAALAQSEQRFRLAFEGNMAPMVFSDQDGLFLAVNGAFCRMSGRSEEELVGHDSQHFTYPEDIGISEDVYRRIKSGEIDEDCYGKRFLHKNGRIVVAEVSICAARDQAGRALYFISSVRDITDERALADQLSYQALHDPLTGLANRALFDDRLVQARSRAAREGKLGAVLLLDLDDFKGVNDAYGHLVGDAALRSVGRMMQEELGGVGLVARLGGEEFALLTSRASLEQVVERLLTFRNRLRATPILIDDVVLRVTLSAGIALRENGDGFDRLYGLADRALYEAKAAGRNQFHFPPSLEPLVNRVAARFEPTARVTALRSA